MPEFSKLAWLKSLAGADLTDGEYRVLVAIFNHTDERGRKCFAKQTTLAAETGKSDRQIRRIIPELIRKGWLAEVRKGAGCSGLSSEYDLSTPEYRTPMTGIQGQSNQPIPDTHDRYSDGIPDISGTNTGHLEHEYRTFPARIPDTHVLPSDPLSDPAIRAGSDPQQGEDSQESDPDSESVSSSPRCYSTTHLRGATDPFASLPSGSSAQGGSVPGEPEPVWVTSEGQRLGSKAATDPWGVPVLSN